MSGRVFRIVALLTLFLGCGACSRKATPEQAQAWSSELVRLHAEQDSLRGRGAELLEKDPRIQRMPEGDVVVSVPTSFLRTVITRVFEDVANRITLRLTGIKAHVSKTVKKVVKIGEFTVDVDITQVVGHLRPGTPDVAFGGNKISMSLPLEIASGHGDAVIHFIWDGKHVAGVACGDMDITQKVSGDVIPASYTLTGALNLNVRGRSVVGALEFPETKLRIRVNPSKESWDAIRKILDDRRGVCGYVIDKVNVPKLLQNLTETKGFNVRVPLDKLKPFVVPAGVRDSVHIGDKSLAVHVQTSTLRIDPDAIWYAAAVSVK